MKPILDLIGHYESSDNYTVVYGGTILPLTKMSVQEVLDWQKSARQAGAKSTAAGRYQIIHDTLEGLIKSTGVDPDELFDENMQDYFAVTLLERRGFDEFLAGTLTLTQFIENLSKEWAAIPKDSSGKSYYDGDGLNKALVPYDELVQSLIFERQEGEEPMAESKEIETVKPGVFTSEFWVAQISTVLVMVLTIINMQFELGLDVADIAMVVLPNLFYILSRLGVKIFDGLSKDQIKALVEKATQKAE